jgi:hypothetical protein
MFIDNFAMRTKAIPDLMKRELLVNVPWGIKEPTALDDLKTALICKVQLFRVNFNADFEIVTDASQHAVGCCLLQRRDSIECPIAFAISK